MLVGVADTLVSEGLLATECHMPLLQSKNLHKFFAQFDNLLWKPSNQYYWDERQLAHSYALNLLPDKKTTSPLSGAEYMLRRYQYAQERCLSFVPCGRLKPRKGFHPAVRVLLRNAEASGYVELLQRLALHQLNLLDDIMCKLAAYFVLTVQCPCNEAAKRAVQMIRCTLKTGSHFDIQARQLLYFIITQRYMAPQGHDAHALFVVAVHHELQIPYKARVMHSSHVQHLTTFPRTFGTRLRNCSFASSTALLCNCEEPKWITAQRRLTAWVCVVDYLLSNRTQATWEISVLLSYTCRALHTIVMFCQPVYTIEHNVDCISNFLLEMDDPLPEL